MRPIGVSKLAFVVLSSQHGAEREDIKEAAPTTLVTGMVELAGGNTSAACINVMGEIT